MGVEYNYLRLASQQNRTLLAKWNTTVKPAARPESWMLPMQQTMTLVLIVLRRFMRRFSRCAYVYTTKKYSQRSFRG